MAGLIISLPLVRARKLGATIIAEAPKYAEDPVEDRYPAWASALILIGLAVGGWALIIGAIDLVVRLT